MKLFTIIFLILIIITVSTCEEKSSSSKSDIIKDIKYSANPLIQKDKKALKKANQFKSVLNHIAKKVSPAVVNIRAEKEVTTNRQSFPDLFDFFRDKQGNPHRKKGPHMAKSIGSGFIISKKGYIVTNAHVIENAKNIVVIFENEKEFQAKIVGVDTISDIAVIKIEAGNNIPVVSLGDSESIKIGNLAIAIGNPFGLSGTFTFGVISAKGRNEGIFDRNAVFKNYIQTDASINKGNSGGPLLNIHGQVIGINTAIYTGGGSGSVGIGFAIPVNVAKNVITQLISKGSVDRGYVGILIRNLDDSIAKFHKLKNSDGVLVNSVEPKGPADKAGVKPGDIILKVNNKKVKNTTELITIVSQIPPGKKAVLNILRKNNHIVLYLRVAKRPNKITWSKENEVKETAPKWLGLSFGSVEHYRKPLKLKEKKGVVILKVDQDSPASKASKPFQQGDIVESINYIPIRVIDSLNRLMQKEKNRTSFLFAILRKGKRHFIVVENK